MLKPKAESHADLNPVETSEWLEALDQIIDVEGPDRAKYLLERLLNKAANNLAFAKGPGAPLAGFFNTPLAL